MLFLKTSRVVDAYSYVQLRDVEYLVDFWWKHKKDKLKIEGKKGSYNICNMVSNIGIIGSFGVNNNLSWEVRKYCTI